MPTQQFKSFKELQDFAKKKQMGSTKAGLQGLAGGAPNSMGLVSTESLNPGTPLLPAFKGLEAAPNAGVLTQKNVELSPWFDKALGSVYTNRDQALAGLPQAQETANMQASNMMAMRGGLGAGAANRLSQSAAEQGAVSRQNILSQSASDIAGLEADKAQAISDLDKYNTGQQLDTAKFNSQNRILETDARNAMDKFKYGQEMKLFGAGNTAYALQNAGGGKK